jgi:tyrosyl-tRNA synthetase
MTKLVHGEDAYSGVMQAIGILFGGSDVSSLDENGWKSIKSEVPTIEVEKDALDGGITMIDLAAMHSDVPSKSEARKLIKSNGFSINKVKETDEKGVVNSERLISGKYMLLQKGKKSYCLLTAK